MSQAAPDLSAVSMDLGEDYPEIRASVRRICADFPGSYWRDLDEKEAYPSDFVQAMTDAGFLSALIPEEYGGAGLPLRAAGVVLEEIHACGGNAGATQKIADYWAISEDGLNALPESKFQDIRNTGALAAVYAHMVSLMNWQRVIQRTMRRLAQ